MSHEHRAESPSPYADDSLAASEESVPSQDQGTPGPSFEEGPGPSFEMGSDDGRNPYADDPAPQPAPQPSRAADEPRPAPAPVRQEEQQPERARTVEDYYVEPEQMREYQVQPHPQAGYANPGYMAPGYYRPPQPDHPQSTAVLVLGILGFMTGITGFIGWAMGASAKNDIQKRGAPYAWDGALRVGYILSIISSVITIGIVAMFTLLIALALAL